jgi:prepilin-type processing-associated H-X9-DG protein
MLSSSQQWQEDLSDEIVHDSQSDARHRRRRSHLRRPHGTCEDDDSSRTQVLSIPELPTERAEHPSRRLGACPQGFGYERQTTLADITDGLSYTMIVAESGRVGEPWLAGGPATIRGLDTAELPYIGVGRQFGGVHPSGMNVGFADGSVRWVENSVNPRILEALSTIAGGETLPVNLFD